MVPEECTYTKEHEWVCHEGGIATIGISEYAATELGDIVYIELTEAGSNVSRWIRSARSKRSRRSRSSSRR